MKTASLIIKDWRNLGEVELDLDARMNVFWGSNGAGKTNLLEAVGVLSTLKSFRDPPWGEIVRWGARVAVVGGHVEGDTGDSWMRVHIDPNGRKAYLDGTAVRDLTPYFNAVRAVIFTPMDVSILRGPRKSEEGSWIGPPFQHGRLTCQR
jgi:DNA replication and repair protein RecF